ncbi:MAG: lysophospholipid acyltransferase family protein [Pseudomonadota bacterium]
MRRSTVDVSASDAPGPGRAWRLVGTAISFALFGLFGLLTGILVMPLMWLLVHPGSRRRRLARRLVSKLFAAFIAVMNGLGVLRYSITGDMQAPTGGGNLIVANHPSLIDVVFLLAIFEGSDCVVKSAHWTNPFMVGVIRTAGFVSNKAPDELMANCIGRLKSGANIVMFPEGTRSTPGEPLRLPRGAASIATRARARCLPVQIRCTPTTLTKSERWYQIPERQVLFELNILPAIETVEFLDSYDSERKASLALNDTLTERLGGPLELREG